MQILALDISTHCGWALGRGWEQPRFGVQHLPSSGDGEFGRTYFAFHQWLCDMLTMHSPDRLVFEAPLSSHGAGQNAARLSLGLAAIAEMVAHIRSVPSNEVAVNTVRLHFCGDGHAKKDDVGFECRQRGWMVADHNAADACAVLDFARHALKLPGMPALGAA